MSALRGALERIGDARQRPVATRSQPAAAPQTVFVDPSQPWSSAPLVAQVFEPPAPPAPIVEAPVEALVGTIAVTPALDAALLESAQHLAKLFPAPALIAFVGCGLVADGPNFVRDLAAAVGGESSRTVEILESSRWDDGERFAAARQSVFRRGALAFSYLSAEKATARSSELGQTSGVVLLVGAGRCDARAADVVATALRLQGVAVRGVLLVD